MNSSVFEERKKIRDDLVALRKPARVPVFSLFTLEAACGLADVSLMASHYDAAIAESAYEKVCETFYSDALPVFNLRFPSVYDILGSKNWVLGSNGAMQHSEFELMRADEYDAFIEGPYKMIMEVFLPRVCSELDKDPANRAVVFAKAFSEYRYRTQTFGATIGRLIERFGYAPGIVTGPLTVAPFDFVADQFRGVKGITGDVYRFPDKVAAAVKAVTPHMIRLAAPRKATQPINCFIPLHLAPLISPDHFERLYWPSLKEIVETAEARGVGSTILFEQDCTRYLEHFSTLPASTIGWADNGDMETYTKTFGAGHAFGGFFDPTITLVRSKEACIDEAKRILDTCMRSEHFFFTFDRNVMDIKSIDIGKLQAVLEWVAHNATY
ncbi:MAG: uroporphyrinogen decarboxylase [Clostridiales Family XIII bacterium]|nr:uroporphyrinogen decarboxylase [Clostridiales Family XIII bacterium]